MRIRLLTSGFILCLALSGVTAFPLLGESELLVKWFGADTCAGRSFPGVASWLGFIHEGVAYNAENYPFMAYGTDWLAFAHIVIAVFFVGVFIDPVRNIWVTKAGMAACILVPVLAFTCGPIRGIPLCWRLIDSGFGVLGVIPLAIIYHWSRQMEETAVGQTR